MTINKEKRKNKVLETIVKVHISNALPVGSKHISKILGLSSATIRNVMFELEKEGYLRQPHTSAGRIPTDLGYRKYVDDIVSLEKFPRDDITLFIKKYLNRQKIFEEVIEATSHAISEITNYTGVALSPRHRLYFDGAYHMLEQPEFSHLDIARDFLRIIEERDEILHIMNQNLEGTDIRVRIGRENIFDELKECTIITSTYKYKNRLSGNIGVIGPMRMKYEKVIPIVKHFAEITSELLEEIPYV